MPHKKKPTRKAKKKMQAGLKRLNTLARKIRKGTKMKWKTAQKKASAQYQKKRKK